MDLAAAYDLPTAIDLVWRRMCRALDLCDALDALRWLRIHRQLKAQLTLELAPASARTRPARTPPPATAVEKVECFFEDSHARAFETTRTLDAGRVHATGPPHSCCKPP